MKDKDIIEMNIADLIMERPISFTIDGQRFLLYQPTLGKNYLISRLVDGLEIKKDILATNPYMEALRLCRSKKDIVCRILALYSLKHKNDIQNEDKVLERKNFFFNRLDDKELVQLLVLTFTWNDIEGYIKYLGLDKERAVRERVAKLKNKKGNGSISFGGKSTYGALIDFACQRYGWSVNYVVWEVSYMNLQMLMADAINTVYLSEDERKELRMFDNNEIINGDDPRNADKIRAIFSD